MAPSRWLTAVGGGGTDSYFDGAQQAAPLPPGFRLGGVTEEGGTPPRSYFDGAQHERPHVPWIAVSGHGDGGWCRQVSLGRTSEGSAGELAGVLAFVDYYFAVDYDVGDAEGELLGVFSGGGGFDGFRVEDDDVGLVAVSEEASGLEAQALGREGGHLSDGLGEAELLLGAYVLSEDYGEAAVGAGAGELSHENCVAADHAAGVGDEGGQGMGVGTHANDAQVKTVVQ